MILQGQWTNKQRVLVFCSRGLGARERHLMEDLRQMMPHSKTEPKHDAKSDLRVINEVSVCQCYHNIILLLPISFFWNLFSIALSSEFCLFLISASHFLYEFDKSLQFCLYILITAHETDEHF